nr:DUF4186 family protein [uncultured Emticicia sp.]
MQGGKCRECEIELVDWDIVQRKDLGDIDTTIAFLKKENIRHHFWNIPINKNFKWANVVQGKDKLSQKALKRLKQSVGCVVSEIFFDGRQTPVTQWNIIFFAQHATATCCRQCIQYWYGIPYDRELTEIELDYFQKLIMRYIDEKLGNIPNAENFQLQLDFN